MIILETICEECIHRKVCKNICEPESFKKCIDDFNVISNLYNFTINISCNDFEKYILKRSCLDD